MIASWRGLDTFRRNKVQLDEVNSEVDFPRISESEYANCEMK